MEKNIDILLYLLLGLIPVSMYFFIRYRRQQRQIQRLKADIDLELSNVTNSESSALPPIPPEAPPENLIKAISQGNCLLFVGSGLSAQSGLPTWVTMLKELVAYGKNRELINDSDAKSLIKSLDKGRHSMVADDLSNRMSHKVMLDYFEERQHGSRLSQAHHIIADLPFAGVLTTNFDSLLTKTYRKRKPILLSYTDTDEFPNDDQFFLLHLYGMLDRKEKLLFTSQEYSRFIGRNKQFSKFMSTLFRRYTFFFVGTSMAGIQDYLEALKLTQDTEKTHYALVGSPNNFDYEERYLKRQYGIHTISFHPNKGYPEVAEFLNQIQHVIPKRRNVGKQSSHLVLKKIILKNIGPFEELQLPFNSSWNVLLGDNGVGKTFILRAIAAALLGEDNDRDIVQRLLSTGALRGRIELYSESRTYSVELERNKNGNVEMSSDSLSPMLFENVLVLGFPALRSVSWKRPKGPTSRHSAERLEPSLEDLFPILTGDPDSRLNDLKQWIINLDYQGKHKMIERFFVVLDKLATDIKFNNPKINKKTFEISVETIDGYVPIESVSQGTSSVICWAGTLFQRMYEVHAEMDNPEDGGAIVLIDEIAAHMHPKWQQSIVQALKKEFKSVQFIVNTHSPLIVAGLDSSEVYLLRRTAPDEETSEKIEVKRPPHELRGWDTDQILTSSVFGLESTLDPQIFEDTKLYTALAASDDVEQHEEKLKELAKRINIKIPEPREREEARLAFKMIEKALDDQLDKMDLSPEKRKIILDEAEVQIQENITGSRRPQ